MSPNIGAMYLGSVKSTETTEELKMSQTKILLIVALLIFGNVFSSLAADLQELSNVSLVKNPGNDGDSFLVLAGDKQHLVRLYFVDCPETSISFKAGAQRLREQMRYFGVSNAIDIIRCGKEAKKFTEDRLSTAFTLHTAFAKAPGGSKKRRIYAFVITSTGNDLASLLVANGYARAHGVGRQTPGGVSLNETKARLLDLEISAMLKRKGIWANSDPDRIVELRAKQRGEDEELRKIMEQAKLAKAPKRPINLNKASAEEVEMIKGIGPKLAQSIIDGRPYKTVDELLKIKGIGKKKFEIIRGDLMIE